MNLCNPFTKSVRIAKHLRTRLNIRFNGECGKNGGATRFPSYLAIFGLLRINELRPTGIPTSLTNFATKNLVGNRGNTGFTCGLNPLAPL